MLPRYLCAVFRMELFPRFLFLGLLTCFMEIEADEFQQILGLNRTLLSPGKQLEQILQMLEQLTGERLGEPQISSEGKDDLTELILKHVLQDISKHCKLRFMISPEKKEAPSNVLNEILGQLEGYKERRGEIMCTRGLKNLNPEEMAKTDNEENKLGEAIKDIWKVDVTPSPTDSDVLVVYINDTTEKIVEGVLLAILYGLHSPEVEEPSQKPFVRILYGNTKQTSTPQNEPNQKWNARSGLLKERKGTNDGWKPENNYTLNRLLLLGFVITFLVFSVVSVTVLSTSAMDDQQVFLVNKLRDDSGESKPNHGMAPLQYTKQEGFDKPLVGGFQHITAEHRKGATDGHKKMKRNHKMTFLKCPHRKMHKRVKHHGINEPICTESSKVRSNPYRDLPIAPPLPEQSFWNQSDILEQSVPKYHFSPYLTDSVKDSDNSGLIPLKAHNEKEYTEKLESLHASGYAGPQRSKNKRVTKETSSPIMITINSYSHHSQLPPSQDDDTANSSIGLTVNQADDCINGSVSSPPPCVDIDVDGIPNSSIQTLHSHADDSIQGTFSSPNQSLSTQPGNETQVLNYSIQSELPHDDNVPGMVRSSIQTLSFHNDEGGLTSGHFNQSLSSHATDRVQGIARLSNWSQTICGEQYKAQDEGAHSHNWGDCKKPIKIPITRTFHPTGIRGESSIRSGSVNHRTDRNTRERKAKSVSQQKSRPYLPRPSLKESIEYPYCYSESSKLDSNKPVILTSLIHRPLDTSVDNEQERRYSPVQSLYTNPKGYKVQDNTSSIRNNAQHQKPAKIPITRIFFDRHKRSGSYNGSLSGNQTAERYTGARRSRSISPQKKHHYSLGSRPNTHFIYPYCCSEALTQDNGKHSLHSQVADNTQHATKSSIQPLCTRVVSVQWVSNSSTPVKHNVQSTSNSSSGRMSCGVDGNRHGTFECMSSSAILPPSTQDDGSVHQTSKPSNRSLSPHVDVSTRHALDFSIYSSCSSVDDNLNSESPIHLLSIGINNSSIKLRCQNRSTESASYSPTKSPSPCSNDKACISYSPTKSLSPCSNDKAHVSHSPAQSLSPCLNDSTHACYSPTQSMPTRFHDNVQNVSNSTTKSVSTSVDLNAQGVPHSSNQSLPMHISDNEKSASHVSTRSLPIHVGDKEHSASQVSFPLLPNNVGDNESESVTQSNDVQHIFNSSPQSQSPDTDNTHSVSRPSISSNFESDGWNAPTYSPVHVVDVKTVSHTSSNSLFIPVNSDKGHISSFSNHSPSFFVDGVLQGTSNLLKQSSFTQVKDNLTDNSCSITQSLRLPADGETQDLLHPSIQSPSSHVAANKRDGTGLSIHSSTSQVDSNKQNVANSVIYSLTSNVDHQLTGSSTPNYSSLPYVDGSVETISEPPSNSLSTHIDSIAQAVSNLTVQSLSTHIDDTVQGNSRSLSQSPSTSVGENRQGVLQTSRPSSSSSSSVRSHSSHDSEQNISSSSIHLPSSCVKDNTLGEFRSSPKSLYIYDYDELTTCRLSRLSTPVAHNAQCTYSSVRSPWIPVHCDISPTHSLSTFLNQSEQSAPHSSSQVSSSYIVENIQDVSTSFTKVCICDGNESAASSPTSTKGFTLPSTQSFPNNIDNRQCILHEVRPLVNSPSSHDNCTAASCSIHSLATFLSNNPSESPPKSSSTCIAQQIVSNSTMQSQPTDHRQNSSHSASQSIFNLAHDNILTSYNSSMHSLRTYVDPKAQSASSSSTLSLSSLIGNIQCLPCTFNQILGAHDNIQGVSTPFTQSTYEDNEQAACFPTTSQLNPGNTTNDEETRGLLHKSRSSLHSPSHSVSYGAGPISSSSVCSLWSKTEKSEKSITSASINSPSGFVHHTARPASSSIPSLSEIEECEQTVPDSPKHSPFILVRDNILGRYKPCPKSPCTYIGDGQQLSSISATQSPSTHVADNLETASSTRPLSDPVSKNVRIVSQSFSGLTDKEAFRSYIHIPPPQTIHNDTLDAARSHSKSLSPNVKDQILFSSSAQSQSAHINSNVQNAYHLQSLSTHVGDNLQNLSPPSPQLLYTHTESTRGDSSSTQSQSNPFSIKPQTVSRSSTHSKPSPVSSNLHGGSYSPTQSSPISNNRHGGSYSSTHSKSSPVNNLQGGSNSPTQSWSSSISNNLQGSPYSPTQFWSNLVNNNPCSVSCSNAHSQSRPSSNNPQVASCPSPHVDDRSNILRVFRPSKHSQSPHAFCTVIPASGFPAHSSVSLVSDNALGVSTCSPTSPTYVGHDQQIASSLSTQLLSSHVPGNALDASHPSTQSKYIHTDNSVQGGAHSSKFTHVDKKIQGLPYSYSQPHSTSAYIKQDESDSSNQLQSSHTTKTKPQVSRSSVQSAWHKYSTDFSPDFSSPAPSSSIFPSSTSPDDSSGAWSSSTHSLCTMSNDYLSSTSSPLIQSSSPRSDDGASFASGYSVTSLYDD